MARSTTRSGSGGRADADALRRGRLARLQRLVAQQDVDALLITRANDIRYLTGFSGEDSWAIVRRAGRPGLVVISDFRFQEELEGILGLAAVAVRKGAIAESAAGLARDLGLKRLAVQSESLTVRTRTQLSALMGPKRLVDSAGLVDRLRVKKDALEIGLIQRAARIQEEAMRVIVPMIRPGIKERVVAARLEFEMKSRGADGVSFETNVSARANGSKPHHRADGTTLAKNTPLLIDWGARVDGYCSDMTRVFFLGKRHPELERVYRVVLEAQEEAIAAIRPGVLCREVDGVARRVIERAGYGPRFGHGLGHGVGLDIHEEPRLARVAEGRLEEGMVVTVEPGVYIPGLGGVRIEDDIVVTARGAKNLCTLPKDLKWATLNG